MKEVREEGGRAMGETRERDRGEKKERKGGGEK